MGFSIGSHFHAPMIDKANEKNIEKLLCEFSSSHRNTKMTYVNRNRNGLVCVGVGVLVVRDPIKRVRFYQIIAPNNPIQK